MVQARWRRLALIAVVALAMAAVAGGARAGELTPEQTVTGYLSALKNGKFAEAYDYISKGMAQNKSRDEWAKEQQWMMQASEAKIFEFKVYPGKIKGDKAYVPDLLSSQDKFLNQLGVEEHELYTLVREDGKWKIDQQQDLERSNVAEWFPAQPAAPKADKPGAASSAPQTP
jgi:hypothetical protein